MYCAKILLFDSLSFSLLDYAEIVFEYVEMPCLLKTGMNSGPNYLKSFYICPQKCGFVKKVRQVVWSTLIYMFCLLEIFCRNITEVYNSITH